MQLHARLLGIAVGALAIAAITAPSRAQSPDPARLAAAKDMMEASRVDKQFEQVIPHLLDRLKESFRTLAPDKRGDIDGVFEQMQSKFISRRGELLDEIAALYALRLEAAEMKVVAEFYRSPVGSKLIDVQPQIMQD